MDRFLMHVTIDYPNDDNEEKIMRLVRSEKAGKGEQPPPKIAQSAMFAARKEIDAVSSVEAVERYIVALIAATRRPSEFGDKLKGWITIGASPRGSSRSTPARAAMPGCRAGISPRPRTCRPSFMTACVIACRSPTKRPLTASGRTM